MNYDRELQIIFYSVLNICPYAILYLTVFRNKLRFSYKVTIVAFLFLNLLHIVAGIAVTTTGKNGLVTLLCLFLYAFFALVFVEAPIGQILFMLFTLISYADVCAILGKYLEFRLFPPELTEVGYAWTQSLATLIIIAVTFYPIFYILNKFFISNFENTDEKRFWRFLWIIPAFFYFVYMYCLFLNEFGSEKWILQSKHIAFVVMFNVGAIAIYAFIIRLLQEILQRQTLESENRILLLQSKQYQNIQEQVQHTRQMRHDLKQHLLILQNYLVSENTQEMNTYINQYLQEYSMETPLSFCKNNAVNALCSYYSELAKENKIPLNISINLPSQLPLPEPDFCVLLGNLLENALEACQIIPEDKRFIKVKIEYMEEKYIGITADNRFNGNLIYENNFLKSTKSKDRGIGTQSIQFLVKKYHGEYSTEYNDDIFMTSILLRPFA